MQINFQQLDFQVDPIQANRMRDYLRDKSFIKVFHNDYTYNFLAWLKMKVQQLREPISLSVMGDVRSGKSVSSIYIACKIASHIGDYRMTADHICANEYEFTEKIQSWVECYGCRNIFPRGTEETDTITCPYCSATELYINTTVDSMITRGVDLDSLKIGLIRHDCFVIDESKQSVYGTGSVSRKTKVADVQNIIAVNNISTIWIRPDSWSYDGAPYGLRAFGKHPYFCMNCKLKFPGETKSQNKPTECPTCKSTEIAPRINRFMIYDLREGGRVAKPFGMVYLPHFADVIPYGLELEQEYLNKKLRWVEKEQRGEGDVTSKQKEIKATRYATDPSFQEMKMKDRMAYVAHIEGSEIPKGEIEEIVRIATMKLKGLIN